MFILRVKDPTLVIFNDLQVHTCMVHTCMCIACACGRRNPVRNRFVFVNCEKIILMHQSPFSEMWPNVICTPNRRGDQREGLEGTVLPHPFLSLLILLVKYHQ